MSYQIIKFLRTIKKVQCSYVDPMSIMLSIYVTKMKIYTLKKLSFRLHSSYYSYKVNAQKETKNIDSKNRQSSNIH